MYVPVVLPGDDILRAFLLGTLPPDRNEEVRAWLEADPTNASRLDAVTARDPLTDAVSDTTIMDSVSDSAIHRIVRGVSDVLHTPPLPTADTSDLPDSGGTTSSVHPSKADYALPWPPVRLGDYRVVREIGRGGMGVVLEVDDEKLGRRVAAKVLNTTLARKPDATARFLREARAAAAVEHENVVPILHVGEEAGTPYIVMPLLRGESLEQRLKSAGKLPVMEVFRIGRDITAGLAAAHAKGLVHRDMKPANVWLEADSGRARVLDFGLARQGDGADALTEAGTLVGTPAYMAPEQIDGQPADTRSDLFSLGAILYECATGQRAFAGASITAILKAVSEHNPAPPGQLNPEVPAPLSELILGLLAKNPSQRPASTTDVLAALAGAFSVPVAASQTAKWVDREAQPPSATPVRHPRRLTLVCTITISFCLLAGLGLGVLDNQYPAGHRNPPGGIQAPPAKGKNDPQPNPVRYRGKIDVLVEREVTPGNFRLLRLNEPGALPLRRDDAFRIEGEVDSPAYVYLVWVDPNHDITPIYPWNAGKGWGSRPATEQPVGRVSLPENVGNRYTAPDAMPGVATMVMFARPTPLDVSDKEVEQWFKQLPELPLPLGGDSAAVWFDDYVETRDEPRLRTFGEVGSNDAFSRWQGALQKAVGDRAAFQTAVSFARTGRK